MHAMAFVDQLNVSSDNITDQEPGIKEFRLAMMFAKVSVTLLFLGIIITWLEWNIIFWESITGPFLLLLSFLMLIVSVKQFLIAKKRREETVCPIDENGGNRVEDGSNNIETIHNNIDTNWSSAGVAELPSYQEVLQSIYCPLSRTDPPYDSLPPSYDQVVSMMLAHDQLMMGVAASSDVTMELPGQESEKPSVEPT
ncbi:Hypothetical predicted protein [Octopus vulgaris]|uniref:Uncharacterized protein n=1 Tax=Octopus vulgaris TaxID=6645 RepID=A0AA36AY95_OCTVU|nr:Hypothetical predicted protein [Octopus vulgaris]